MLCPDCKNANVWAWCPECGRVGGKEIVDAGTLDALRELVDHCEGVYRHQWERCQVLAVQKCGTDYPRQAAPPCEATQAARAILDAAK